MKCKYGSGIGMVRNHDSVPKYQVYVQMQVCTFCTYYFSRFPNWIIKSNLNGTRVPASVPPGTLVPGTWYR